MKQELANITAGQQMGDTSSILLGTGLAIVSMIIVPAFAVRLGLNESLTGALRIALMKASSKALKGTPSR
ncbi:MAG: hypothetical protein K9L60_01170 [Methylovulum sp.]|jgi:hypothetical protein|nr:hypothetical protein [Methylovulum sp.]MCF7997717.1 hypothetical protein [Methylovulum sp.]